MNKPLQLVVVSQDKKLLDLPVTSVTAPTTTGEVTILPQHVPLFTPLQTGELRYEADKAEYTVVVSKGFMDVGPDNVVTIMVDVAKTERDISLDKAQQAVEEAHQAMQNTRDRAELMMAEASLRLALLEIKVAQKSKKTTL